MKGKDLLERVSVISRVDMGEAVRVLKKVVLLLEKKGSIVEVESKGAEKIKRLDLARKTSEMNGKLIITIGGDGTILYAHRRLSHLNSPFLPVKVGRWGFLTEITPSQVEQSLKLMGEDKFFLDRRSMVTLKLESLEREALNEVLIYSHVVRRPIGVKVYLDGEKTLTSLCDGLIVSSPTGSIAYFSSLTRCILDPCVDAMCVSFVNPWPFSLKPPVSSIVVGPERKISISFFKGEAAVAVDGFFERKLGEGEKLELFKSDRCFTIIRFSKNFFYRKLKSVGDESAGVEQ